MLGRGLHGKGVGYEGDGAPDVRCRLAEGGQGCGGPEGGKGSHARVDGERRRSGRIIERCDLLRERGKAQIVAGEGDRAAVEFMFKRAIDGQGDVANVDDAEQLVHDGRQAARDDEADEARSFRAKLPGAEAGGGVDDDGRQAVPGSGEDGLLHGGLGFEVGICGAAPCSRHGIERRWRAGKRGEGTDEDQAQAVGARSVDDAAGVAQAGADGLAPCGTAGDAGIERIWRGGIDEDVVSGGELGESAGVKACYGYRKTAQGNGMALAGEGSHGVFAGERVAHDRLA